MKYCIPLLISILMLNVGWSQNGIDKTLKRYNSLSVPYISVEELDQLKEELLLDTREKEEYDVSHLKDAIWVGYKDFKINEFMAEHPDKEQFIVVYCSVGVRSENIGEKLLKKGYNNVKNLYGGIFQWTNLGFPVYDTLGNKTLRVHAYGKEWSSLLTKAVKVY
jgi:rhodanese-related sulfurtransferase